MTREEYIEAHISPEPPHLAALYRRTHLQRLYPRMCTDSIQGRLLAMLTGMIAPLNVLELGTFTGYSALCMAEGLKPGGRIDTVEIDPDYADELRELFAASPGGRSIHLHIGDALALIPRLMDAGDYDMVFIDADKRAYPQYLDLIVPRLKTGAYILADNTLWSDKLLDGAHDAQTAGIAAFNDRVGADPSLAKAIVPVRDGLTIIRKI